MFSTGIDLLLEQWVQQFVKKSERTSNENDLSGFRTSVSEGHIRNGGWGDLHDTFMKYLLRVSH
jgi:hypothetical protein